jgi:predicted NUDIX family NTP pyrophosphohydrolase
MSKQSAGILLYRERSNHLEVLLVHFGGPFWAGKDRGAWSIPKGELEPNEDPLTAAKRELEEETGVIASAELLPLDPIRQAGGKVVHAWAMRGDVDPNAIKSNMFVMEWPPNSGKQQEFPEIDRAEWLGVDVAEEKIMKSQAGFIAQLLAKL